MLRRSDTKKKLTGSIGFFIAAAVAIALASASTPTAQVNTSYGGNALANTTSDFLGDSAFGNYALNADTTRGAWAW